MPPKSFAASPSPPQLQLFPVLSSSVLLISTEQGPHARGPTSLREPLHSSSYTRSCAQLTFQLQVVQLSLHGPYGLLACPHPAIAPSPQANAPTHPSLLSMHRPMCNVPNSPYGPRANPPAFPASPPGPQTPIQALSPSSQPCPHTP